jgi:hypothetical protein
MLPTSEAAARLSARRLDGRRGVDSTMGYCAGLGGALVVAVEVVLAVVVVVVVVVVVALGASP